jgi:hypothetical protein
VEGNGVGRDCVSIPGVLRVWWCLVAVLVTMTVVKEVITRTDDTLTAADDASVGAEDTEELTANESVVPG